MGAAAYALQLIGLLPQLVGAGQSIMGLVNQGWSSLSSMVAENRGPTPEEIAALRALTDSVHAQIQSVPNK